MTPDDPDAGTPALLGAFRRQALDLTRIVGEIQNIEAEATDKGGLVTVRVTAGGTVRSVSIQLAGDRVGPGTLGRTIAATTNQAFANARSAAEAHLHEYRATQQEFTEQLRRHDPDTARALAELTAATRGATAETQEAADTETRPRPWSPLG